MQIVQAPNIVLSEKAQKILKIDKTITNLIEEMQQTLIKAKDPEGVGLAAPQVGKSLQLFITKPTPNAKFTTFINPEINFIETPQTTQTTIEKEKNISLKKLEGCLSLDNIWGPVHRHSKVNVIYLDENGKMHKQTFTGFMATIIQHEYDHLQGILFPRRVLEQHGKLYKSKKDKEGDTIFEELGI